MPPTYKVWVHVEEVDEDNYQDTGLPVCLGEFQTAGEAHALVTLLEAQYAPEA